MLSSDGHRLVAMISCIYELILAGRFLRNLETIYGRETLEVFPNQHYSLVVSGNNYLQTLNLASLKRIENGGVRIISNRQLCLVDTISVEDYLITSSLHRVGDYAQDCSSKQYAHNTS